MIVICEECGKKYRIDPSKIKEEEVRFKCKVCSHILTITHSETSKAAYIPSSDQSNDDRKAVSDHRLKPTENKTETEASNEEHLTARPRQENKKTSPSVTKSRGVGIRTKMMLLFLIIPILIIAAASYLYLDRLTVLASSLIEKSTGLVTDMSESIIAETARSSALQSGIYLESHPDLTPEKFDSSFEFRRLSQKKLGITGYTFLFSLGDESSEPTIWVHPNPSALGEPLAKVMKQNLGSNYPDFENIIAPIKTGQKFENGGYYHQKDGDGQTRRKYLAATPIEGTHLAIAATTFIDEFTLPVSNLEKDAQRTTEKTRIFIGYILAGALVLIGLIVAVYSTSLSGKIKKLTEIANRISVGELDEEVRVKSRDEIGALAEAVSRMQDSIRLSIQRLRRKR